MGVGGKVDSLDYVYRTLCLMILPSCGRIFVRSGCEKTCADLLLDGSSVFGIGDG